MHLTRRSRHDRIAASLAAHTGGELAALQRAASRNRVGVGGGTSTADVDGVPVFVKRIPITDRELAHPHSTANLFDLPVHWQYGMYRLAGPGFNAWREPAANQSVTDGVLAGETQSFPLLHHWRVLPGRPPVAAEHRDIDVVVTQFGGNPAVRARLEALACATASLVLFLEHLPLDLRRPPPQSSMTRQGPMRSCTRPSGPGRRKAGRGPAVCSRVAPAGTPRRRTSSAPTSTVVHRSGGRRPR